jgi:predicted acylesterase/phospholipase RssA
MSLPPEPLDPAEEPPIDRYCDLVLTGGLTDGVVYPWAVLELARQYRFKNIGGTSVGAMAAALTAAAEYARRQGHLTGFNEVLRKLPEKLAENIDGKTRLFSLFQPAPLTRRLFDLFVSYFSTGALGSAAASYSKEFASAEKKKFATVRRISSRAGKLVVLLGALFRVYGLAALLGGILGLLVLLNILQAIGLSPAALLLLPPYGIAALLLLLLPAILLGSLILIAYDAYTDLVRGLVPNGFGLCNGGHGKGFPANQSSIVEWLYEGIQAAAGKQLDQPLTFKDLWDAPCGPAERPRPPALAQRKPRSIDLRMVTTNLTHGRPYALPLGGLNTGSGEYDQTNRLFFKLGELNDYFPPQVIAYLESHSQPYRKIERDDPDPEQVEEVARFRELPQGELPIVVAARLSLSFPVLFSTVPLWAIDSEADQKRKTLQRCSFTDGGLCSNFPIHLFDAAVPDWPTFGIWLAPRNIWKTETLWLPEFHDQGRGDVWNRFADPISVTNNAAIPPLDRLVGFLAGIVYGAKDWNDRVTLRMPGVRDRVIRVFLDADSQGLNLKLTGGQIMELASKYGQPAGKALVGKFIDTSRGNSPSRAWNEHRWVRFHTFLVGLRERIEALRAAAEFAGYSKPLSQQIVEAQIAAPLRERSDGAGRTLSEGEAGELQSLLGALEELELKFARAQIPQPYQPVPTPGLHVRPPL